MLHIPLINIKKILPHSFIDHPQALQIDAARHRAFMRLTISHLIIGIVSGLLIYLLYSRFATPMTPLIWGVANLVLVLTTCVFYYVYFKKSTHLSLGMWSKITFAIAATWGVCWALPPFLMTHGAPLLYIGLMFIFVISLVSIPAPAMAHYPYAYFVFMTIPLFALGVKVMQLNEEGSLLLMIMTPFLWFSLIVYGWDLHKTVINSIKLRIENQQAYKISEQANLAKSKFIATASHDIRQPLQAAILLLEALKRSSSKQQTTELVIGLEKSMDYMSSLLNGLLDISKLDAQTLEHYPEHTQLKNIFDSLEAEYRLLPTDKSDISLTFESKQQVLYADPLMLRRVLENLLTNAIRYTVKGQILVTAYPKESTVFIQVSDTGVGIQEENITLIFDEFFQVGNSQRSHKNGMGLGLPIVKRICELQNWSLQVESEVHKGSTFTVGVPKGVEAEIIEHSPSIGLKFTHVKLLLIDDEDTVRENLAELFAAWGCAVSAARNIDEAKHAILSATPYPNLIVLDYGLGGNETGLDALDILNEIITTPFETVMLTGDTAPDDLKAINERNITLLHKPIKPAALRSVIQQKMSYL